MKYLKLITAGLLLTASTSALFAHGHNKYEKVQIKTIPLNNGIYMLIGQGGNIAISIGEDGVLMVDDQFAPLTKKIKNAIKTITDKPVKYAFNTHWHFDHTGGNENLANDGVILVSHDNVRQRLLTGGVIKAINKKIEPSPAVALPDITFNDKMTFHINNETVEIIHKPHAHTDGDAILYFKNANVLHTGDVYVSGFYPFIDSSSGGSMDGIIDALTSILPKIDDNTKIIPGHGKLSNKKELKEYRDTMIVLKDRMQKLITQGKTLDEVLDMMPNQDIDKKLGGGFIKPKQFIKILYGTMKNK